MMEPRVELLRDYETLIVVDGEGGTKTTIIAGEHNGQSATIDTISDLSILRVEMNPIKCGDTMRKALILPSSSI